MNDPIYNLYFANGLLVLGLVFSVAMDRLFGSSPMATYIYCALVVTYIVGYTIHIIYNELKEE